MSEDQIKGKEYTVSIFRIYALSVLILMLILILFVLPFSLVWSNTLFENIKLYFIGVKDNWDRMFFYIHFLKDIFCLSLIIIIGAIFHELLHAFFWMFFTKKGIKSISFGFSKTDFSPYIHCKEPLAVWVYRIGTVLPAVILGVLPLSISIITGSFKLLLFGIFFLWAASGDIIILWKIRNLNKTTLLQDHPEKVGCIVIE